MRMSRIHLSATGLRSVPAIDRLPARRRSMVCAAILAASLVGVPALAQSLIQGLGDLTGGLGANAYGVSGDGAVVVGFSYYIAPGGLLKSHAFRWTQAGGMHAVFEDGLDYTSSALCISADGLTIGGWHALTITEEKAFIWSAANGELQLDTRSGVTALAGTGAVGAGYIVHGSGEPPRAGIWNSTGNRTFIDSPGVIVPGSDARGISADGTVVVGQAMFSPVTAGRAFRWTAATGMQNIGSPDAGGPTSHADAITPDGSVIVGAAQATGGSGPQEAALWTAAGGWQILGSLSGTPGGTAYAVSADGQTVVGASGGHAFIWRPGRGIEDLLAVLGSPPGWTLTEARGISADGRIIVGNGIQAWIATLPLYGDMNCDGSVNFGDINQFVLFLSNPSQWQANYPDCPLINGDINNDGTFPSFSDINPFVSLLSSGG